MMERQKQEGHGAHVAPGSDDTDHHDARLVGEVASELVENLGPTPWMGDVGPARAGGGAGMQICLYGQPFTLRKRG